jgi:hypothetical protein
LRTRIRTRSEGATLVCSRWFYCATDLRTKLVVEKNEIGSIVTSFIK